MRLQFCELPLSLCFEAYAELCAHIATDQIYTEHFISTARRVIDKRAANAMQHAYMIY